MAEPTKTLALALMATAAAWMPAGALAPAGGADVAPGEPLPSVPGAEPLPTVPGWNSDYLDGLSSEQFAPVLHDHDARYFTEAESDARFLGTGAQAADSDLLDGLDSSAFALAGHTHAGPRVFSAASNAAMAVPAWPSCLLNYISVSGNAPAPGKVVVEVDLRLETNHVAGTTDQAHLTPTDSANDCSGRDAEASWIIHWVPAPLPTAVFKATLHTSRVFDVGAGGFTIYLNGHTDLGADAGDRVLAATLIATWYPS